MALYADRGDGDGASLNGIALCAGAGGLELGIHIALGNYRTVCYVERDAYAAATLVARMEDAALDQAPIWDDIRTFAGRSWRGIVDIITAGYPCQPFSQAGLRRGKADPRHLWPHVRRIIVQVRPALVFLENVEGHLSLGYRDVRRDLETFGYRVEGGLFAATEVGASQQRNRLFILACHDGFGGGESARLLKKRPALADEQSKAVANDPGEGLRRARADEAGVASEAGSSGEARRAASGVRGASLSGGRLPLFPPRPSDYTGWLELLRHQPAALPTVRRGADGMACRLDRLRLCGNGVVPLAAAHAFRILAARLGLL